MKGTVSVFSSKLPRKYENARTNEMTLRQKKFAMPISLQHNVVEHRYMKVWNFDRLSDLNLKYQRFTP